MVGTILNDEGGTTPSPIVLLGIVGARSHQAAVLDSMLMIRTILVNGAISCSWGRPLPAS